MPSGGKRAGAGRKPGPAWAGGGGAAAVPRAATTRAKGRSLVRDLLAGEQRDPLTVLVALANDPAEPSHLRAQCAAWAAPFMFPRLSASVVATAPLTAKDDTAALVSRIYERFQRIAETVPATIDGQAVAVTACPA